MLAQFNCASDSLSVTRTLLPAHRTRSSQKEAAVHPQGQSLSIYGASTPESPETTLARPLQKSVR